MPQAHSSQLQHWLVRGAPSNPSLSGLARFSCAGRANAPNIPASVFIARLGHSSNRRRHFWIGDNASFVRRLGTPQGEWPCQVVIILGVAPVGSTVMPVTHADSDNVEIQTKSKPKQASSTRNHRRAAIANIIAAEVRVASGQDDTVTLFFLPNARRECCRGETAASQALSVQSSPRGRGLSVLPLHH